jgi:hypothetical protein
MFGFGEDPQQTLDEIQREIDEAEAFLRELYEQKKEAVLRDRLTATGTQPQDKNSKSYLSASAADPIAKTHQRVEEMRKSKKKLRIDEARVKAREAKNQRLQEIIHEFGLDPNAKWTMVEFNVPTDEELTEKSDE